MTEWPQTSETGGDGPPRTYALDREDERTWVIRENSPARRAAPVVARIVMTEDDDVRVAWLRSTPLPVIYSNPRDVLESLEAWQKRPNGGTKPVPIPHFPPPTRHRR